MKWFSFLIGVSILCKSALAVDWDEIQISADENYFYFNVVISDIPFSASASEFRLYTKLGSSVVPDNQEQFVVDFVNFMGIGIVDGPRVESIGIPDMDRWQDGEVSAFTLAHLGSGDWRFAGSISNGTEPYRSGDNLGEIRFNYSGGTLLLPAPPIGTAPELSMSLAKTSTTESVITAGQVVPYKYVIRNTGQIILHNIALADDNIDAPPVCLFIGRNELALAPDPASFVACSAQHTVTQLEIEVEGNLDNTASATSEETEVVITSLSIPIRIFSDGFEAAKNIITVLDDPESEVGEQNSIAIGADGFPVISYHDRTTGSLKVAKCNDVACTGKDETISTVDDPDNSVGWYNSLVIGSDGFPVISYHDETAGTLKVAKCNDVACTGSDETITTVDGLVNDVGDYTSIAIGTDTFPVISYYARGLGALKVVKCNDTACSGSNEIITTVDGLASNVGLWNSLAISTDGFPVIGYNHFFPARSLKVVKCNDAACAGGDETISTVDGLDSDVGQFISLAISTDGFPVISYQDFSLARALKVAKCNDAACTGSDETITTVDGLVNDVGAWTSLAIGSDGSPVISYFDSTAGALKVAKCNDPSCSGGDETISTVDNPANQVGLLSSIVIGVDGLPVISYLDNTTKELKVMHCGRPDCS